MQFPTFWKSNRVVFMKIFLAMWRLFSVKNRVSFLTLRVRSVKTGKCCETEHTVFRPYPRSLACLTICRCETKAAHSSQLCKSVGPAGIRTQAYRSVATSAQINTKTTTTGVYSS